MAGSLVLAGCTAASSPIASGPRTIPVTGRDDFSWDPDQFTVRLGETVLFEVVNQGDAVHEFFIGDEAAQDAHEMEMREDGMAHEDGAAIEIDPGETGTLQYTFGVAGTLLIGCHEPGHYAAGMVATIEVQP